MSTQPINNMSLYSSYGVEGFGGENQDLNPPATHLLESSNSKVIECTQQHFNPEIAESSDEEPFFKNVALDEGSLEDSDDLKDKVFSTVDSDIHSAKPTDDSGFDEMKAILCADPSTIATPNDCPSRTEGKYLLKFNYHRLREFLLDDNKFENILTILSLATDSERDKMEAVLFRFAVTFDEKEISKNGDAEITTFLVESEVQTIQERLKKSIRQVKNRDKKRSAILCMMPKSRKSSFLESFFQKN